MSESRRNTAIACLGLAQQWIAHSPMIGEEYQKAYKKENLVLLAGWLADWVENYAAQPQKEGK